MEVPIPTCHRGLEHFARTWSVNKTLSHATITELRASVPQYLFVLVLAVPLAQMTALSLLRLRESFSEHLETDRQTASAHHLVQAVRWIDI